MTNERPRIQIAEASIIPAGRPPVSSVDMPDKQMTSSAPKRRRGRPSQSDMFVWKKHLTAIGAQFIKAYSLTHPTLSYPQIAREFDISVHIVEDLLGGKTWRHVK